VCFFLKYPFAAIKKPLPKEKAKLAFSPVKAIKIQKDLYRLCSKGLANNVTLPIKPEKLLSRNDDFIVQLLPFRRKYFITNTI
jgi:hypothetical protein